MNLIRRIMVGALCCVVTGMHAGDIKPLIGLSDEDREASVILLKGVLADHVLLYMRFLNAHWNVQGPFFGPLHELCEKNYSELFTNIDDLAERIRALGYTAPGTFAEMVELSALSEEPGVRYVMPLHVLEGMLEGYEEVIERVRDAYLNVAHVDGATENFLAELLQHHEKAAWMLRAHLEMYL